MNKSIKWAYWGLISLNAVACIVYLLAGLFWEAYTFAICAIFLLICYKLAKTIIVQEFIIKESAKLADEYAKAIQEFLKREVIAKNELAKMRKRAETAEKELANLPVRDSLGRYAKRTKS